MFVALAERFGLDILVPEPIDVDRLGSGVFRVANVAIVVLVGPFAEEVFFRGFLLTALMPPSAHSGPPRSRPPCSRSVTSTWASWSRSSSPGWLLSLALRQDAVHMAAHAAHAGQNTLAIIGLFAST